MSDNDDQDRIPYRNAPLQAATQQRKLDADSRINEGRLAGYMGPDGKTYAWTGDREAPYVKILQDPPAIVAVSDIPQDDPLGDGVLIASLSASSLHEAWANDSREDTTEPRWLQLFDRVDAPTTGTTIPSYAAIRLCGTASYDFIVAPLQFNTGIVVAISSTPNIYTAIAAASDYAITARVLAGS